LNRSRFVGIPGGMIPALTVCGWALVVVLGFILGRVALFACADAIHGWIVRRDIRRHTPTEPWPDSGRPRCSRCGKAQYEEIRSARRGGGATVFWRCPRCEDVVVVPGKVPTRKDGPA
jgi:hypothetical protein